MEVTEIMKKSVIKEIYYSNDYLHVYIVIESNYTNKHKCITICFKECNIRKFSFTTSMINMPISSVDICNIKDGLKDIVISFIDNNKGQLLLSCSEIEVL